MSYKPLYTTNFFRQHQNEQWLKRNQFRPKQMWREISFLGFEKRQQKEINKKNPETKQIVSPLHIQMFYFRDFSTRCRIQCFKPLSKFQFWTHVLKLDLGYLQLLILIPDASFLAQSSRFSLAQGGEANFPISEISMRSIWLPHAPFSVAIKW